MEHAPVIFICCQNLYIHIIMVDPAINDMYLNCQPATRNSVIVHKCALFPDHNYFFRVEKNPCLNH